MKILQINKYFYKKGGAETVFFNTIDLLETNGHTVIPFSLKNEKNTPSNYEAYFVDYPELSESGLLTKIKNVSKFVYNKDAAKQLDKLLTIEKPDIAHIHLLFNGFSVSILPILQKHKIPVVMTAHDYRLVCPGYTMTNSQNEICERCLKSQQYWKCVANRCSSKSVANSILLSLDSYFRKYFYTPLTYIDHFIFVSNFSRSKYISANKKYESKSSKLYNFTLIEADEVVEKENEIVFFGRISQEKGVQTLIDAVKDEKAIKLKIIGDGPLLKDLKQYESENIQFLGYKSGNELKQYVEKARFVVISSECYENNPMTIIEAMTLGTPVIGSNIGGIPELIEDAKTGFLFEPKSAADLRKTIHKAMASTPEQYKSMSDAAKQFASDYFSAKSHYNRLIEIYEQVVSDYQK